MAAIERLIGSMIRRYEAFDSITWVTHKLLTVVAAGNLTVWDIFMTWSKILKPPFLGVCFFDDRTRVTYCSHLVYSNEIQEINMSSNAILMFFVIPMLIPP